MAIWDPGNLGSWEFGILGIWDLGNLGSWDLGNLGQPKLGILGICSCNTSVAVAILVLLGYPNKTSVEVAAEIAVEVG